ncbi:MAG: hypothetical protein ABJA71_00365 [Ginsengibacter sp.]
MQSDENTCNYDLITKRNDKSGKRTVERVVLQMKGRASALVNLRMYPPAQTGANGNKRRLIA